MKAKVIVLMLFSIIAVLAVIGWLWPAEGVTIAGVKIDFPSPMEILTDSAGSAASEAAAAENAAQARLDALKDAKDAEFRQFCEGDPARIHVPGGRVEYLDPLFDALEEAQKSGRVVRVMHYGDSQLEGDRITGHLREELQSVFGGEGPGLIPVNQTIPSFTVGQTLSPTLPRYVAFGSSELRIKNSQYGPMAQMSRLDGSCTVTMQTRGEKDYPHAQKFKRLTLIAQGDVTARVTSGDMAVDFVGTSGATSDAVQILTATLPQQVTRATVTITGHANLYGLTMDGTRGVAVDNIPMRGCSGTIFTNIARSSLEGYFKAANVRLLLLEYGGNAMPYLSSGKGIGTYKESIKKQIDLFKSMMPKDGCIIFMGPADMATRVEGSMQSYPHIEDVIQALREGALECGVAYWDMYAAMGGHNSILQWVNASPALAGKDYIHFTPRGSKKMSHLLFETLQLYHKFYRFRTGRDVLQLSTDSTSTDSVVMMRTDTAHAI